MGDWSSEVRVSDTPSGEDEGYARRVAPRPCGACGGSDTVCVSARGGGSIIGAWSDEEFLCGACGKYTIFSQEYDS